MIKDFIDEMKDQISKHKRLAQKHLQFAEALEEALSKADGLEADFVVHRPDGKIARRFKGRKSSVDQTLEILEDEGREMHVNEILERLDKPIQRNSLQSSLDRAIARGHPRLRRTKPATYGLITIHNLSAALTPTLNVTVRESIERAVSRGKVKKQKEK